ncbi:MAG: AMP-binding protein [Acidobacteriota bacterium]
MLSYSKGPNIPLLDRTIGEQLEINAKRWSDQLAVVSCHQTKRLTWAQLLAAADRVAHGLAKLGIEPADRVGVWAMNCWEWLVVHMACARAGAILVNVNPACRAHELAFILKNSRMKVLFLRERDAKADYAAVLNEVRGGGDFTLSGAIYFDSSGWEGLLAEEPRPTAAHIEIDDVTNIQYTSGTTGSPKGVLLTHRNILNNGFLSARVLRYTEHDRICLAVPFAHCFGNVIGTMSALASGCALILPKDTFDPRAVLAAIEAERATAIYGVPTMFIAELRHSEFSRFDLSSLRTGVMAGAPCPIEVMKQAIAEMHCREMIIGYGLTETAPLITMSEVDDDLEHRVSTVGNAMPCTELKVVDLESRETLERGAQGEICARGYMLMQGYDGDPDATARVVDGDGWFRTGDLGVMREDGYLNITGRAKDMIIRGGENIYPREIEEFLYTHAKIAEVQVTGLPHECLGEVVLAWIRLKSGETATAEDIREFCLGQIAKFKIPESIRFVDSFPTTLSGKIQKFRMREIEIGEQGLEGIARGKTA